MREANHNFLYLIWKDPESRRNFTVGKLSKGKSYTFEYCEEYERALEAGWDFLKAFPEDRKYESPTLFAAFESRLPDSKRRGIEDILKNYGLTEFDGFELLRKSTGRLPIDTYEFIDPIFPEDKTIEREFYIVGIRHSSKCRGTNCGLLPKIELGESVVFMPEPTNEYDPFAIAVLTQDNEMLGYVPRYYSEGIARRLERGMTYECRVMEIDHHEGCENCIKVHLVIPKNA